LIVVQPWMSFERRLRRPKVLAPKVLAVLAGMGEINGTAVEAIILSCQLLFYKSRNSKFLPGRWFVVEFISNNLLEMLAIMNKGDGKCGS
jgi:hypothetical protein